MSYVSPLPCLYHMFRCFNLRTSFVWSFRLRKNRTEVFRISQHLNLFFARVTFISFVWWWCSGQWSWAWGRGYLQPGVSRRCFVLEHELMNIRRRSVSFVRHDLEVIALSSHTFFSPFTLIFLWAASHHCIWFLGSLLPGSVHSDSWLIESHIGRTFRQWKFGPPRFFLIVIRPP